MPLIIGDMIEEDDDYWENFLEFLTIMEYIFSPVTSENKIDYLRILVQDYLITFVHLYPERPLVPKMHYLIHMPGWMKRY